MPAGMTRIILILLLLTAGGCQSLSFLPAGAGATLANPTHVEAYSLGTIDAHPGLGGKMDGFAVIGTQKIDDQSAKEIAAIAADPASYRDRMPGADFVPIVGYRFYRRLDSGRGQVSVDVLLDFQADLVMIVTRDNRVREYFRRIVNSAPSRQRLLDLTQQVFPMNTDVQSIPAYPTTGDQSAGE
jgi:hypothetical protein